jgi:hypothetical protein
MTMFIGGMVYWRDAPELIDMGSVLWRSGGLLARGYPAFRWPADRCDAVSRSHGGGLV